MNEPSIQYKPPVKLDGLAFDDSGQPVAVYRSKDPPLKFDLLWTLKEMGVSFPDDAAALSAIEQSFDKVALERRLEELNWIIDKVGRDSAAGVALDKLFRQSFSSLRNLSPKEKVARWLKRKFENVNTKVE
jgi:hypothetical protein